MRYRSRLTEGTSSVENTSSFATTPQESLGSEEHATSSTSSPGSQIKEEYPLTDKRKMPSEWVEMNNANSQDLKKLRHDSLVSPTMVKTESSGDSIPNLNIELCTRYEGSLPLEQAMTTPVPGHASFWPMTYDHSGGLTTLYPDSQDAIIEQHTYDAWSNIALEFQAYDDHTAITYETGNNIPQREAATNLDFMPLSANH